MTEPRISSESEGRIVRAIEDAKSAIDQGTRPQDAFTKVATDMDLPPGHIRLMVQAFNTAQVNRQRKTAGDDIFEKAATVEIVNAQNIIDKLFPPAGHTKSAAQAHDENVVSDEYKRRPDWYSRLRGREKAATAAPLEKTAQCYPRDESRHVKKAHSLLVEARQAEEELRREVSRCRDKLASEFEQLEHYFRTPGCLPFDEVAENAALLWGKYAADVMTQVALARKKFAKEASLGPRGAPVLAHRAPYSHVQGCVDAIAAYHCKKASLETLRSETAPVVRKLSRQFSPSPVRAFLSLDDLDEKCAADGSLVGSTVSSALGSAAGAGIMGKVMGKGDDKLKLDAYQAVSDPAHEAKIKSLQTQAALHDMLANDQVISGYQPEEVLKAFNEIQQLAPRSAAQPMLARALIRKHLAQGQLDPFDINQLTGVEYNLKYRDSSDPASGADMPAVAEAK